MSESSSRFLNSPWRCLVAASAVMLGACSSQASPDTAQSVATSQIAIESIGPAPVDVDTTLAAVAATTLAAAVETPSAAEPATEPTQPIIQPAISPESLTNQDSATIAPPTTTAVPPTPTTTAETKPATTTTSLLHVESSTTTSNLEVEPIPTVIYNAMQFIVEYPAAEIAKNIGWMANSIRAGAASGGKPILILESPGDYSQDKPEDIAELFKQFKARGITAEQLGWITVVPEMVAGFGGDISTFADKYNAFSGAILESYPEAEVGVLIDVSPYEYPGVLAQASRLKVVRHIGIQLFSNGEQVQFPNGQADLGNYWNNVTVEQIAKSLGNTNVWLNFGDPAVDGGITYTLEQRQSVVRQIAANIEALKKNGVQLVAMNIFAENKLNTAEKRDFSFTPSEEASIVKILARTNLPINIFAPKE